MLAGGAGSLARGRAAAGTESDGTGARNFAPLARAARRVELVRPARSPGAGQPARGQRTFGAMRLRTPSAAALLFFAACSTHDPQPRAPQGVALSDAMERPPVVALIGYRQSLDLSTEQVNALDSIGRWIAAENDTLADELRASGAADDRGSSARARRAARRLPRNRLVAQRIRENHLQAADGVGDLLDENQKRRACELFETRSSGQMISIEGNPTVPGSSGGVRRVGGGQRVTPWPWCVEAAEPG